MLLRNVTPPLPNTDYIQSMIASLKKHLQAIKTAQIEFEFYFKQSIPRQQKIAPKEFEQAYLQLQAFGTEFVKCFDEFNSGIEPILKTNVDLLKMKDELSKSLERYQKQILVVRKEMTEANIKIEGEKLQDFANKFAEFNKQSNLLKTCLLQLYKSSCLQLENGMSKGLQILNNAVDSPLATQNTEEEIELDKYIQKLNQEIVEKQQKEKEEREKREKEEREKKEEEEKQQKEKEEAAQQNVQSEGNEKEEAIKKDDQNQNESNENAPDQTQQASVDQTESHPGGNNQNNTSNEQATPSESNAETPKENEVAADQNEASTPNPSAE